MTKQAKQEKTMNAKTCPNPQRHQPNPRLALSPTPWLLGVKYPP
ncbi:hypothetical protein OT109_09090 [Phycisphaeraceae bacterium D3-23]